MTLPFQILTKRRAVSTCMTAKRAKALSAKAKRDQRRGFSSVAFDRRSHNGQIRGAS